MWLQFRATCDLSDGTRSIDPSCLNVSLTLELGVTTLGVYSRLMCNYRIERLLLCMDLSTFSISHANQKYMKSGKPLKPVWFPGQLHVIVPLEFIVYVR